MVSQWFHRKDMLVKKYKSWKDEIKGIWEIILLDRANNYQIKSIEIEISHQSNYRFESDKQTFYVSLNTPFIGGEFALKLLPAWDWEKIVPCLVFSGLDRQDFVSGVKRLLEVVKSKSICNFLKNKKEEIP